MPAEGVLKVKVANSVPKTVKKPGAIVLMMFERINCHDQIECKYKQSGDSPERTW